MILVLDCDRMPQKCTVYRCLPYSLASVSLLRYPVLLLRSISQHKRQWCYPAIYNDDLFNICSDVDKMTGNHGNKKQRGPERRWSAFREACEKVMMREIRKLEREREERRRGREREGERDREREKLAVHRAISSFSKEDFGEMGDGEGEAGTSLSYSLCHALSLSHSLSFCCPSMTTLFFSFSYSVIYFSLPFQLSP